MEEHSKGFKKTFQELMTHLRSCDALGVLDLAHQRFLENSTRFQTAMDAITDSSASWEGFVDFAGLNLEIINDTSEHLTKDLELIYENAQKRVELSNPPCSEKKKRPLGDCLVWEKVLLLLERNEGAVWLASTDTDFCSSYDVSNLNYFLFRETIDRGGKLEFFHEDRSLGLNPGSTFLILDAFTDSIPEHISETMREAINAFSSISPNISWAQLTEALNKLNYREREILKLRFGWDLSGFDYTQNEVARIFKLSQPRVSQIQQKAMKKMREALAVGLDEEE